MFYDFYWFSAGILVNSVVIYICGHFTLSYRLISYFCAVVFIVLVCRLLLWCGMFYVVLCLLC